MKPSSWLAAVAGSWHGSQRSRRPPLHRRSSWRSSGRDGRVFREFPVTARDGALRSYLQAEKGERYEVRVRNTTGQRLGLVIAVDGRNIINGRKSELARGEPMYVLDAWSTQDYAGWRANLSAINEFYFTDWSDSYAEAFGDRFRARRDRGRGLSRSAAAAARATSHTSPTVTTSSAARRNRRLRRPRRARMARWKNPSVVRGAANPPARATASAASITRSKSEFVAESRADSRHFIKYEWRERCVASACWSAARRSASRIASGTNPSWASRRRRRGADLRTNNIRRVNNEDSATHS